MKGVNRTMMGLLLCIVFFTGCKQQGEKTETEKLVEEWLGKEILFPSDYQCNFMGNDTVEGICKETERKEYTIFAYIDSLGCTRCKFKFLEWEKLLEEFEREFPGKVSFVYYIPARTRDDLEFMLKRDAITFPVRIDSLNTVNNLNNLPEISEYQGFLLDSENRVLVLGNPVMNPQIRELYKRKIAGKNTVKKEKQTTVEMGSTSYDFGEIRINAPSYARFRLKNTGDNALVIKQVSASCGCTSVEYEKQPIAPGQETEVKVEMNQNEPGYFSKTIDIFCNTEDSPVRLTVNGHAVN